MFRLRDSRQANVTLEGLEPRLLLTGVHVVPADINHDGTVEVTAAIQSFIDSVEDDSTIVFQPGGRYWIENTLTIAKRSDLIIDGNGSTFEARDLIDYVADPDRAHGRSQWAVNTRSQDIVLENMTIIGALPNAGPGGPYYPEREAQHGINIGLSYGVLVQNVRSGYTAGDTMYIGSGATDITVLNSVFDHGGRQAFSVCDANNVWIEGNYIANGKRSLIDIEPYGDNMEVHNVTFINNILGKSNNSMFAMGGNYTGTFVIANNIYTGDNQNGLFGNGGRADARRGPFIVANNVGLTYTGDSPGVTTSYVDGVVVVGNKFGDLGGRPSLSDTNGMGAVIGNNLFNNASMAPYVDTGNLDVHMWANLLSDPGNWDSKTLVTAMDDGVAVVSHDVLEAGGTLLVVVRRAGGTAAVSANGLTTTGEAAIVILSPDGDFVDAWTYGGQANYLGMPIGQLGKAPMIVQQPAAQTAVNGQAVSLSVEADGGLPIGFQWTKNGNVIPDATGSSYSFTAAAGDSGAVYACILTNKYGTTTTGGATLTVVAAAAPTITQQPAGTAATIGEVAVFRVAASGPGPIGYQWQVNSGGGWADIGGAAAATFVTPVLGAGDNGSQYRCRATSAHGQTYSNAATLTVSLTTTVSESWTVPNGGAWPTQWVKEGPGSFLYDVQGGEGRVDAPRDASEYSVAYANTLNAQNVDITTTFRFGGNAGMFGLVARRNDANSDAYYYTEVKAVKGNFEIWKTVDGTPTLIASLGNGSDTEQNTYYYMRFYVSTVGAVTELKLKRWLTTENEPDYWQLETTDDTPELQNVAGKVGLHFGPRLDRDIYVDDFAAETLAGAHTPAAPTELTARLRSGSHTRLTWVDQADNESGYIIQRSADGSTWYDLAVAAANATTYVDSGLAADTRYYYRVRAYGVAGHSDFSNVVRATTPDAAVGSVSETWTGADGDAWAEKWMLDGETAKVASMSVQGGDGRLTAVGGAGGVALAYVATAFAESVSQTVTLRFSANGAGGGLMARRSDANSNTYYVAQIVAGSGTLSIYAVLDDAMTLVGSASIGTVAADTDYIVRFLVQTNGAATDLKAKVWQAGQGEPTGWAVETSDATAALQGAEGRFGLFYKLAGGKSVYADDYSASYEGMPSAVSGLVVTPVASNRLDLAWTNQSAAADGIFIRRSPDGSTHWTTIATIGPSQTAYSDMAGLSASTRYYYAVVPFTDGAESMYPIIDSAVTLDPEGTVQESWTGSDYEHWDSKWTMDGQASETWTGSDGSSWPAQWTVENGSHIATRDISGNYGRVVCDGSASGGNALAFVNAATGVDVDQIVTFHVDSYGAGAGLVARRSDGDSDTYYAVELDVENGANSSTLTVYKVVDGVRTVVAGGQVAIANALVLGQDYKVRFIVQASNATTTTLQAKYWQANNPEGSWNVNTTDGDGRLQGVVGRLGLYYKLANNAGIYVDDYRAPAGASNWDIYNGKGRTTSIQNAGNLLLTYVNTATGINVDETATFSVTSNGAGFGLFARRADNNPDSYYSVRIDQGGSSKLTIYKVVDGVGTSAGQYTYAISANVDYQVRFLCQDTGSSTNLKAKIWPAGTAEPAWQLERTDSTSVLQDLSERFGVVTRLNNGRTIYVDDFSATYDNETVGGAPAASAAEAPAGAGEEPPADVEMLAGEPAAPSDVDASGVSTQAILVTWTDNSTDEQNFVVERSPNGTDGWVVMQTTGANVTSWTDTNNMSDGQLGDDEAMFQYWYRVKATNASGSSAYSNVASGTNLNAPANLVAGAVDATHIDVYWTDKSLHESGYKIERSPDGSTGWTQVGTAGASVWSYHDPSALSPATTYYYRVRAYNAAGNTVYSNVASATTGVLTPATPVELGVYGIYDTRVDVIWRDSSSTETQFRVERSPDGVSNWQQIAATAPNVTRYTDFSVAPDTTYYYRVRAHNASGDSAYTDVKNDFTEPAIPAAPTSLAATAGSPGEIHLAWADNANNETGFLLERAPTSGGDWTRIAVLNADATSYDDTDLAAGTTYYYHVRAYGLYAGISAFSNVDDATTASADQTPPTVSSSQVNRGADVRSTIRQVAIGFSEDVGASLAADDIALYDQTHDQAVNIAGAVLSYDSPSLTATLDLSALDLADAYYLLSVSGAGVTDAAGNSLDGDGNGSAGGDWTLQFAKLGGDASGDAIVDVRDLGVLGAHYGQSGNWWELPGDMNADGIVDVRDLGMLGAHYGQSLPVPPGGEVSTAAPAGQAADAVQPATLAAGPAPASDSGSPAIGIGGSVASAAGAQGITVDVLRNVAIASPSDVTTVISDSFDPAAPPAGLEVLDLLSMPK